MKIAFNSANLVGRITGYHFKLTDWATNHARTAKETDAKTFADICREIAETGFTAVELWQALADPSVMTEERAKERRTIMDDHGLQPIAYGGYIRTGAENVSGRLRIDEVNSMFKTNPGAGTALS